MANILVVYVCTTHPLRASQRDHLLSFRRYATGHRCFYWNVAFRTLPWYLRRVRFDLIVYAWSFANSRLDEVHFPKYLRRVEPLKRAPGVKIALPQDEFVRMDALCDFINEFGVDHVFSVAPESEWPKLYRTVDFGKVRFSRVLTGYLDEGTIARVNHLLKSNGSRPVDIGYRSGSFAWWGRFNLLKEQLARRVQEQAERRALATDIRFGWKQFLLGDDWFRFLARCKYIPGVEGGSSILDWDGRLTAKVLAFLKTKPQASFDEIEAACFPPGKDGEIRVTALSPRHLEACLTRTCQVLIEGEYNGVLQPGTHYLELKRDFSNLDRVMEIVQQDQLRQRIVDQAYQDVVASGRYTYAHFVADVITTALSDSSSRIAESRWRIRFERTAYRWGRVADALTWIRVFSWARLRDMRDQLRRVGQLVRRMISVFGSDAQGDIS